MSASGELSARNSSVEQSEQVRTSVSGFRLNLIDWVVIAVALAGLTSIIYLLSW
jgi:hypothetical protein